MTTQTTPYPLRIHGHLDGELSRWKWLVKWLLLIPHFVVLIFLWLAFGVLTIVAFFAIVFTGRYPRGIFDFTTGVLRWSWRVQFYSYQANGTDRYPPFTLAEVPDYPATLTVDYPEHLSRGLVWVKWWLLAIPHYIVVAIFAGGGAWLAWDDGGAAARWGGGLIGVLVLIAAVVLLFTGSYPRPIFDFVMGMNRWVLRVAAYAGLMTDQYPPFRLDMGDDELSGTQTAATVTAPTAMHTHRRWTGGRIALVVIGSLVALGGAALLAGGTAGVVVDQTRRDDAGFVMAPDRTFTTASFAIVSETVELEGDGPDWLYVDDLVGQVKLESDADTDVFVGIARAADVERFLGAVPRDVLRDLGTWRTDYDFRPGTAAATSPASQSFWAASSNGAGDRELRWTPEPGDWQVVAMNSDASRGVDVRLALGAEVPHLLGFAVTVLVTGAVLLALAALLITLGARRPHDQTPAADEPPTPA